jgi:hypothetical protein
LALYELCPLISITWNTSRLQKKETEVKPLLHQPNFRPGKLFFRSNKDNLDNLFGAGNIGIFTLPGRFGDLTGIFVGFTSWAALVMTMVGDLPPSD